MAGMPEHDHAAGPRPRFTERVRESLRETLLDAATEVLCEQGWRATRMADVAARAGVSRQTLYQHFGSREALAQAIMLRGADRFLREVEQAVARHADDARAALAASFEVFLSAAADDGLIKAVVSRDGNEELVALLAQHGPPVLAAARQRLETCIRHTWPGGDPADAALVAECVVRLAISYLTLPSSAPELTGQAVARLLGPFVSAATTSRRPGREPGRE